ncbi:MAG: outer membrane protein assembly factor BamB family protein, partial [Planctomycetota bacterium]
MLIATSTLLVLTFVAAPATDDRPTDWPQFLGPRGTAVAERGPDTLRFDLEKDVRWRVTLPTGSSSPCITGDRIFLTASEGRELLMLALDRRTGATLWRRAVTSPGMGLSGHVDADPAAPTPCTDGTRVVFYFGGYGLLVCDMEGDLLWQKKLPVPEAEFSIGTSPILVGDDVILLRDGCPDSGLYAFAKHDGTERWRVPRLGFTFSFGTPFVWRNADRQELVVAGTQRLTSYDPTDGTELWQIGGLTTFVCTTPTADKETLYFAAWSTSDSQQLERSAVSF